MPIRTGTTGIRSIAISSSLLLLAACSGNSASGGAGGGASGVSGAVGFSSTGGQSATGVRGFGTGGIAQTTGASAANGGSANAQGGTATNPTTTVLQGGTSTGPATTAVGGTVIGQGGTASATSTKATAGGSSSRGGTSAAGSATKATGGTSAAGSKAIGGASAAGAKATGGASTGGAAAAGASSKATGGTSAGGSSGVVKSSGCGNSAPLTAVTQVKITVGADARSYLISPPSKYDPNTAYPLVFIFHGAGQTGENIHSWFPLETAANGAALFVYPDGLNGAWDLKNEGSDTKLFDQLVTNLSAAWCLDKNAIFIVGVSYGGWAATQMAVARPTVLRGIASIAGGGPQGGKNTDPPVAVMLIHGTADTDEPIASSTKARTHFLATNGCAATTTAMSPSPCVSYDGCLSGKPVDWCEHPGPHGVPDFAPAGVWNFFMSLR